MQTILIEAVLLVGLLVLASLLAKAGMRRLRLPPEVAFILLGILLRGIDLATPGRLLKEGIEEVLLFMADLGVVALMFRVGLDSNLKKLKGQLGRASLVWAPNMLVSGLAGFVGAYYVLSFGWIPSLAIAVALTATSVGIPASVWQRTGRLESDEGQLFVDVAELDDISGVVLMAMLFSVLPVLRDGAGDANLAWTVLRSVGVFLGLFAGFVVLCASRRDPPGRDRHDRDAEGAGQGPVGRAP
jgi:Kef-type K+ transport system membrane component KefB